MSPLDSRRAVLSVFVGVAIIMSALVVRVAFDSAQAYDAAGGADVTWLEFAAGQIGPGSSAPDAAVELARLSADPEGEASRSREALVAASTSARSWGTRPHHEHLNPAARRLAEHGESRFGSPSGWGRVLMLVAFWGWITGCLVLIWRGFDARGELERGRGQVGAVVALVFLVCWLGSVFWV